MHERPPPSIAVLGATGRVGSRVVARALERGYSVAAQTRRAGKLDHLAESVRVHAFDPHDPVAMAAFLRGADAVVFALGVERGGRTSLFSDVTRVLLDAMREAGVPRLIAVTGVGAGATRGHGGFVYDRIVFPLITRPRYADKDRQEALIAQSDRDWVIVRPAPFKDRVPDTPLEVHVEIAPETVLRRVTPDEVARFILDQVETDTHLGTRPFIGHA
jgi:putative NADH-flavin reductase